MAGLIIKIPFYTVMGYLANKNYPNGVFEVFVIDDGLGLVVLGAGLLISMPKHFNSTNKPIQAVLGVKFKKLLDFCK